MTSLSPLTVLVPAYNEEPRLEAVLDVICQWPGHRRTIIIDDGSRDATAELAASYPVEVLRHWQNLGKAAALETGIHYAGPAEYWLFVDADLINLRPEHLEQLLEPLQDDPDCAMTVGRFQGGTARVDLAHRFFGILNGQRALRGSFVQTLPGLSWARFGVEIFLSCLARERGLKVVEPVLRGLTHHTKEDKLGLFRGVQDRLAMYRECIYAYRHWRRYTNYPRAKSDWELRAAVIR